MEANDYGDVGDVEQSATDLFDGRDYPWLTAMMAPRPTLLAYNAEDDCCFRAAMVKPLVYDAVRPFFALYGKQESFAWHENRDPGTHNYQLDNRMAAYDFFSRQFHLPAIKEDPEIGAEVKSYDELKVGLPDDNLTIVGLARKLADSVHRDTGTGGLDAERAGLRTLLRYRPAKIDRLWTTGISKHGGVETKSHLFSMAGGLPATAIWLKPIGIANTAPATIILDDKGRGAASVPVTDRLSRSEQVLALDLSFQGEAWIHGDTWLLEQMLNTTGDRPLGVEAAQLIAIANWWKHHGAPKVRLETGGIRSQVVALVASALEPSLFSEVVVRRGMPSLRHLVDKPVKYADAPDLFCLDLYRFTDLDRLTALAAPAVVKTEASH